MKDRAYEIARNHGGDGCQTALASMVYKFFDKKAGSGTIVTSRALVSINEELAEEVHKPWAKKIKRRKIYARFKDKVWAADKKVKDKKDKTVFNAFIEIVNEFNCKPNKLWVDQGREFYKKIKASNSKSYLPYLNKLVEQYSNTYHHSINMLWPKKLRSILKLLSLKLMTESE